MRKLIFNGNDKGIEPGFKRIGLLCEVFGDKFKINFQAVKQYSASKILRIKGIAEKNKILKIFRKKNIFIVSN